jgi:hypothetical protein
MDVPRGTPKSIDQNHQRRLGIHPLFGDLSQLPCYAGSCGQTVRKDDQVSTGNDGDERKAVSCIHAGRGYELVRNVRAAEGKATLRHGIREQVHLEEVDVSQRAPILKAFLRHAPGARPHIQVSKDAPTSEFEKIASKYPVFQVKQ